MEFSTRSMNTLLKQTTSKQVSKEAANQLGEVLEKFSEDVPKDAVSLAAEDGYQTVKTTHIKDALKQGRNREFKQSYL